MNEHVALNDDADEIAPAVAKPAAVRPAALIKQKRTFRSGIHVAPIAAAITAPAVVGSFLDPDFLYARSLQVLAVVGAGAAVVGLIMLVRGLSRRSRRLHSSKFWMSVLANVLVLVALGAATAHSYRWGHPLHDPQTNVGSDN